MMASLMEFDLLPVLNEGEEHIRLLDILMLRDSALSEQELWALCLECCIAIQNVNSTDMFQALCITPESLAFDSTGAVSFLDLARDPDVSYIPPEYEAVGNSYKAHLFSLGLTMLYAADFNGDDADQGHLGEELRSMIQRMRAEDYDKRVSLEQVMKICEHNLQGESSQDLCMEMASVAKIDSSEDAEDGAYSRQDDFTPSPKPQEFTSVLAESVTAEPPLDRDHDLPKLPKDCQPVDTQTSGAITPPAAFRNTLDDYKRAIAESPTTSAPLVSPPKVSRMVALLDNGELKRVEMPSSSGSDSAGEDSKTPNILTPSSATPTLSQKSSPVPAFDLGVSQNSAFQVVWSPRSSKSASPVIGQGQSSTDNAKSNGSAFESTGSSGLQVLTDVKNVNYTTLFSATRIESKGKGNASVQDREDLSNKAKSKTETRLKSVKSKLDELMVKYNQRSNLKLELGRSDIVPTLSSSSPLRDSAAMETSQESTTPTMLDVSNHSNSPDYPSNDFEFGPSISPVPTFARGQSYSDSSAAESDAEDDVVEEGSESDGPGRSPMLKVSREMLQNAPSNKCGEDDPDTQGRNDWASLDQIMEGREEEEEGEEEDVEGESGLSSSEGDHTEAASRSEDDSVAEDMEAESDDDGSNFGVEDLSNETSSTLQMTLSICEDVEEEEQDATFSLISAEIDESELEASGSMTGSEHVATVHGQAGEMITGGLVMVEENSFDHHASHAAQAPSGDGTVTRANVPPQHAMHTRNVQKPTEATSLCSLGRTGLRDTAHANRPELQIHSGTLSASDRGLSTLSGSNVNSTLTQKDSNFSHIVEVHEGILFPPGDVPGYHDSSLQLEEGMTGEWASPTDTNEDDNTVTSSEPTDSDNSSAALTAEVDGEEVSRGTTPSSRVGSPNNQDLDSGSEPANHSPSQTPNPGELTEEEDGKDNSSSSTTTEKITKDTLSDEEGPTKVTDTDKIESSAEKETGITVAKMSARGMTAWDGTGDKRNNFGKPDRQAQTIQEMLEKLSCGLHENELWALCRECVNALQRFRYELPAYISLETVFLEERGEVGYQAVPEDRELEVVYLAPELQQHGVVTEKTCLFGIAAMLWSAADYKLPPNQEPALSEELENLLISMTQDNQELRPRASHVLQVCSDYDRRHEVSSTKVCQALYSDAQKAEAFGKDNALVRDSLGEDLKEQQLSHQAQVMSCIKLSSELQAQLKPVSARQLAAKPVVRSLHDKLMDEILNPTKKLRKSSRPKVINVREIFMNAPELMAELKRVTGQHFYDNSAFSAKGPGGLQQQPQNRVLNCQTTMPNAYKSPATHFSPIILPPTVQTSLNSEKSKSVMASESMHGDKDRKVARKLKELKKNLFKNRLPLNIAQDLENEDRHDRTIGQRSHLASLNDGQGHVTAAGLNQLRSQTLGSSPATAPLMAPSGLPGAQGTIVQSPPVNNAGGIFPFQVQLQHDPRTGLFQLIPVPVQGQMQQQQQQPFMGNQTPPAVYNGASPNQVLQQQNGKSMAEELADRIQSESEERRRYLKYTQELRSRVKSEVSENDQQFQQSHRTRSSAAALKSGDRRSDGKVKTRSSRDKEGHRRSHTVSASNLAKSDLSKATNNVRNRAKESKSSRSGRSDSNGLKKSSSEENLIEKVQQSNKTVVRTQGSEDMRTRLKRAKSGSSLDYRNLEMKVKDIQTDHPSLGPHGHFVSNGNNNQLSKSNPNLDLDLTHDEVRRSRETARRSRTGHSHDEGHVRSPLGEVGNSPPPSPSLSKDSGVSGLNLKASGELSLMERLLNSDTIRHQQRLSKVIRLLRDEFAFDGYMENGVEDLAMAEYVLSLANLKWETFNNAITEKYCDLFWQDELLTGLFEAVNGTRPVIEKRIPTNHGGIDKMSNGQQRIPSLGNQKGPVSMASHQSPGRTANHMAAMSPGKPSIVNSPNKHGQNNQNSPNHISWNGTEIHPVNRDNFTGSSAFRPIRNSVTEKPATVNHESTVYKPKPVKVAGSHTDTSDSTDNEISQRPRRYRKKNQLDKGKSSSMHDLFLEKPELEGDESLITKSHSQGNLIDEVHEAVDPGMVSSPRRMTNHVVNHPQHPNRQHQMGIAVSLDGNKPKVVYIRSSESENDSYESNTNAAYQGDDHTQRGRHMRALANMTAGYRNNNSYVYRYDSDSSSTSEQRNSAQYQTNTLPFQRQNAARMGNRSLSREDSHSESSRGSSQSTGRRITSAKSESYLNVLSSGDEFGSHERLQAGRPRLFRGSVVYYAAEMEHKLRPKIRDFAMQVWSQRKKLVKDTRTKESIEAKMSEIDQQMMVEHRQKRKTMRFYQKLAEACRSGKGADQKGMLGKVSKQLMEMTTKLDFLDSAKKHLEMLYAEQWGLDHYLLYSLAKCPPDQPMLLSPCENPMLQYQTIKGTIGAGDGQILQAGLPDGLMAYQFAQHALSEGYLHQFFYCFRYFVTPAEFLDFLMDKYEAAALSLSPEAAVPAKVKARCLDLLQVWIEGYYSIDFKHNPELTQVLYDFIKDKILPMDANAEYILELLEDAQDDRHVDLYYPQFSHTDDLELYPVVTDAQPKKVKKGQIREWESFKAALHLSAKPVKIRQPLRTHMSMSTDRYPSSPDIDKCDHDVYFPRTQTGFRFETFVLGDYTAQTLAEQLTLMEQDLFRQSHPVHYLNSKAQGVGVALTTPAINKAQSMYRLTAAWEDNQESSLFVGTFTTDDIIQRMIEHSQAISFWAAAEIVSAGTSKAQVASITKFLCTARMCHEMRNYATCISILDGLENVLVRQVPAWRSLPSKYVAIMEELASVRVFLKSDAMCLLENRGYGVSAIPCILLFLLHVQQMEIGGFRLANTMYKWTKMKTISKVIDQIRIFKERSYMYEADRDLQELIRQRMRELGQQDLHVLAAQHDANFQRVASRMPGIFKRMKGKMGKSVEA